MGRTFDTVGAMRLKLATAIQANRLLDLSGGAVELKVRTVGPHGQSEMFPAPISLCELRRLRTGLW
jgi:hypothetical protein